MLRAAYRMTKEVQYIIETPNIVNHLNYNAILYKPTEKVVFKCP